MSHSFHACSKIVAFLTNICARSRKVTVNIATPKEVKTPKGREKVVGCAFLIIGKRILFLKRLEFNSFLKFYLWACRYVLHWNLVFVIYAICFAQFSYNILRKIYLFLCKSLSVGSFYYKWNKNLIAFLYKRNTCFEIHTEISGRLVKMPYLITVVPHKFWIIKLSSSIAMNWQVSYQT